MVLLTKRDGKDRERRQGRERKEECLGERRKRKAATPKAQTLKSKKQLFSPFSSFLFDFSFFSLSLFLASKNNKTKNTQKSTQMTDKKDVKAQSVDELEALVGQGDMDAKRELAIRLMEGNGVPQNHPKAVALLEDCVALGDAEAMLMLAKCCAFGHGIGQCAERAESLICEAASKGNDEAQSLRKLLSGWKGKYSINLEGLFSTHWTRLFGQNILMFITGRIEGEMTIERVCLLMNIIPCKEIDLEGQMCQYLTEHCLTQRLFHGFVLSVSHGEHHWRRRSNINE